MLEFINKYLLGTAVPVSLTLTGVYFLFKLKFFPVTRFPTVVRSFKRNGKSSFGALALSLAGTLGVGNMVGVASAIFSGGFGAVFWMWVSAAVASVLKYAEILLAMRHRTCSSEGFKGGAPYYIKSVLSKKFPAAGAAVASLFALLCVINCFSMGAVMQTHAVSGAFELVFDAKKAVGGGIVAVLVAFVAVGGAKRITRLTSAMVPFMSLFYLLISLAVIIPRAELLPEVFGRIFKSAFSFESAAGGVGGFLLSRSLRFGVMRGLFSNEAGCGTSPTAHISSDSHPCEQGFMGILEVFIDTVLLCSMTAFAVMLRYDSLTSLAEKPMQAVISAYSGAFSPAFGDFVEVMMAFMVFCFGFAAVSCLAHYAFECLKFLPVKRPSRRIFALAYGAAAFAGAFVSSEAAWAVSDATVGAMTLINLAILLFCRNEIGRETALYFDKKKNISDFDKKFTKYS